MSNISFSSQKRPGAAPLKSPTAYQLRALVLDYLCHQCFTNTARAFLQDSAVKELDADGDEVLSSPDEAASSEAAGKESPQALLRNVQQRQEIRELILAGRVDDAIDILNQHFPAVLSNSLSIPTQSTSGDSEDTFTYASETSMVPAHLLLNLRVQAFIEACRTRPLEIPPHKFTPRASSTEDISLGNPMDISDDYPSSHRSSSSRRPSTSTSHTHRSGKEPQYGDITPARLSSLLHKGQKLYALAAGLPNSKDKDVYQKELANVGGLLAYPVPEESPVSRYLSYERREALADQVNRAILYRSGRPPISDIELLTRYTTALWQSARSYGAKVRSGACIPPTPPNSTTPAAGSKSDDAVNEEVPTFDLRQFLDFKP